MTVSIRKRGWLLGSGTALYLFTMAADLWSAEVKFVTEYRYPTSYQVTPIVGVGPNGNAQIMGGIVTPQDFETREVGVRMSVYAVVGQMTGVAGVADANGFLNGNTDLIMAAASGDQRGATKAVEGGTGVNVRNRFGSTALLGAAAGGFEKIVELLLQHKADVNQKSESGSTPLMFAAKNGHTAIVQILLKQGARVNETDTDGQTALAQAVRGGHSAVVRQLLESGANPDLADRQGTTPLMLARTDDNRDLIVLLTRPTTPK